MKKETKKELIIYAILLILVILMRTFIVTPVRVNGESMNNTLSNKQIMILDKISYRFSNPKRFDIIVIKLKDETLIKRVIGLPGESLEYTNNVLYINGKEVKEPFLDQETSDFSIKDLGYDKIPDNCYIALGDNRAVSLDSRYFGCFKKEEIKGKTSLVIYPFKDFGYKE